MTILFLQSSQDVALSHNKSVDEKVLDVVRAAERLVKPTPRVFPNPPSALKKKKTTTIVLSKHVIEHSPIEEVNFFVNNLTEIYFKVL